ncbi:hypothetical protein BIW11_13722, partial [Tropilaelaps mercedesae]
MLFGAQSRRRSKGDNPISQRTSVVMTAVDNDGVPTGGTRLIGGSPMEEGFIIGLHPQELLPQKLLEYRVSSMNLPPHAALYPHIYDTPQSQDPLTPPPTPGLSCSRPSSCTVPSGPLEYSPRSSLSSDAYQKRRSPEHPKVFQTSKYRYGKSSRNVRLTCKPHTRVSLSRVQTTASIAADEFLVKEVGRAMAIFVMRRKARGRSITIREIRNKANHVVTALRGKGTSYRVGRKWARIFLRGSDKPLSQSNTLKDERMPVAQSQQYMHWKKAYVS